MAIHLGYPTRTPLLLMAGMGSSLETLDPFVYEIDLQSSLVAYALLVARMLDQLGYRQIDVLGFSWGGGIAQRFVYHQLLARCRKIHALQAQQCSDEAFLEAGHWIVEHADLLLLVWNGYPAGGKGGAADVASYARSMRRPFLHIHTRQHTIKQYGSLQNDSEKRYGVPLRELAVTQQVVYRGPVLQVKQYRWQLPDRNEIVRDIVERPESVLVLPVAHISQEISVELEIFVSTRR